MMALVFLRPEQLGWLLLLPLVLSLIALTAWRNAGVLARLSRTPPPEFKSLLRKHRKRLALLGMALACLVVALARPGWKPDQEPLTRESRDVIFVLDVSRSMLAQDRSPNRLENAKATILHCVGKLDPGQRIALVLFAGDTLIKCPLTSDRGFFRMALQGAKPDAVSYGGTKIGEALRVASDKLLTDDMCGFQDIVLVTDGGDHEEASVSAVDQINQKQASLLVIGVGSDRIASRIPIQTEEGPGFMTHDGREVWTQLEMGPLEQLVQASKRGLILNAGIRAVDLADIYQQYARHADQKAVMTDMVEHYEEGFSWLLAASMGFLLCGWPIKRIGLVLACIGALTVCSRDVPAGEAERVYNQGNELFRHQKYTHAVSAYEQAATQTGKRDVQYRCFYNMGLCFAFMAETDFEEETSGTRRMVSPSERYRNAIQYFRAALDMKPGDRPAGHNLELARWRLQRFLEEEANARKDSDPSPESESSDAEDDSADGNPTGEASEDAEPSESLEEGELRIDMNMQDILPPTLNPQNILQEEILNRMRRAEQGGRKPHPVERDW